MYIPFLSSDQMDRVRNSNSNSGGPRHFGRHSEFGGFDEAEHERGGLCLHEG